MTRKQRLLLRAIKRLDREYERAVAKPAKPRAPMRAASKKA